MTTAATGHTTGRRVRRSLFRSDGHTGRGTIRGGHLTTDGITGVTQDFIRRSMMSMLRFTDLDLVTEYTITDFTVADSDVSLMADTVTVMVGMIAMVTDAPLTEVIPMAESDEARPA